MVRKRIPDDILAPTTIPACEAPRAFRGPPGYTRRMLRLPIICATLSIFLGAACDPKNDCAVCAPEATTTTGLDTSTGEPPPDTSDTAPVDTTGTTEATDESGTADPSATGWETGGLSCEAAPIINLVDARLVEHAGRKFAHLKIRAFRAGTADLEYYGLRPPSATDLDALAQARAASTTPLNTTIGVVATDADLDQACTKRIAMAAHDGLARAIVPAHSPLDGDTIFAVATGAVPGAARDAVREFTPVGMHRDVAIVAEVSAAAATVTQRAIVNAVLAATPVADIASLRSLLPSAVVGPAPVVAVTSEAPPVPVVAASVSPLSLSGGVAAAAVAVVDDVLTGADLAQVDLVDLVRGALLEEERPPREEPHPCTSRMSPSTR